MRILILDDTKSFRQFLVRALEKELDHTDLTEATSFRVGKILFESDPYFELIFCNIDMEKEKKENPFSFITHIQESYPSVTIVAYSHKKPLPLNSKTLFFSREELQNFNVAIERIPSLSKSKLYTRNRNENNGKLI